MRTCSTNMLLREVFELPNIFTVSGYRVYFWANENNEPIHVHISKGSPVPNSTKVWLTRAGGCIVANNKSNIHVLAAIVRGLNAAAAIMRL